MAINDEIPGIEVVICMPGTNPLEEIEMENEPHPLMGVQSLSAVENDPHPIFGVQSLSAAEIQDLRTVTRQVEGESGQIFSINITLEPEFEFDSRVLVFVVSVDGQEVGQYPHLSQEYFLSCVSIGIRCEHMFMAPEFRFGHAEHPDMSDQPSGSIVVRVYHKSTLDSIWRRARGANGSISSKKIGQGVNCSSALPSPPSYGASAGSNEPSELADDAGIPHAIFHFKYCRKAIILTIPGLDDLTANQTRRVRKLLAESRRCAGCGKSDAMNNVEHACSDSPARSDSPAKRGSVDDSEELGSPAKKIQAKASSPEVDSDKTKRSK